MRGRAFVGACVLSVGQTGRRARARRCARDQSSVLLLCTAAVRKLLKINHVFLEISCVFVLLFMLLRITLACPRVLLPLQLRSNLINVKSSRVTCARYEIIAGPIKSVHFKCLRTRRVERKMATADVLQKWNSEVLPEHPVDRDSPCFRTTG